MTSFYTILLLLSTTRALLQRQDYVIDFQHQSCSLLPGFSSRAVQTLPSLFVLEPYSLIDPSRQLVTWVMADNEVTQAMLEGARVNVTAARDWPASVSRLWWQIACRLNTDSFGKKLARLWDASEPLFAVSDLLIRYQLCVRGLDVIANCPGPCGGRRNPCEDVQNSDLSCEAVESTDVASTRPGSLLARLQARVSRRPRCRCKFGFKFVEERCVKDFEAWQCGVGSSPCLHGGVCRVADDDIECRCRPAFSGEFCEHPRDPCRLLRDPCGRFKCQRDPTSPRGFVCFCPAGFRPGRSPDSPCVDVDECRQPGLCRNGGECHNVDGGFFCACPKGFSGQLCEDAARWPVWTAWSQWSDCIVDEEGCDTDSFQQQTRECVSNALLESCPGHRRRTRPCAVIRPECEENQPISEQELGEALVYPEDEVKVEEAKRQTPDRLGGLAVFVFLAVTMTATVWYSSSLLIEALQRGS